MLTLKQCRVVTCRRVAILQRSAAIGVSRKGRFSENNWQVKENARETCRFSRFCKKADLKEKVLTK